MATATKYQLHNFDEFRALVPVGQKADLIDGVIHVASPDNIEHDYHEKRKQYQEAGVVEYWIVDSFQRKITAFRLGRNGKFRSIKPRNGRLGLPSIADSGYASRGCGKGRCRRNPKSSRNS